MIGKKKLFAAVFVLLFGALLVIGVSAWSGRVKLPEVVDRPNDTVLMQPESQEEGGGSAYSMPSVGSRWWETYATSTAYTTSNAFSNMPYMYRSIYLPHAGHVEVRLTVEFRHSRTDNCEIRCRALKGTTYYYARPGYYWLGRGDYYGATQTRTYNFVFENLAPGSYTVYIQWRAMNSGRYTYAYARILTATWYMYP